MKNTDLNSEQKRYLIEEYQKNELQCSEIAANFSTKFGFKLHEEYVGRWMAIWGVPRRDASIHRRIILNRRYGKQIKSTWL
jgi:hypothetical protein